MNIVEIQNTILRTCLENVKNLLGRNITIQQEPHQGPRRPDFMLTVPGHPTLRFIGECKTNIATRAQADYALLQAKTYADPNAQVIIFTRWIPEPVAEAFREKKVFFADTVGNAYLWHPPQFVVDVRGHRPEQRFGPEPGRIIEVGGLKICHLLLTRPDLLRKPLRTIAREAWVGLGTAHTVMRELMAMRWVLPGKNDERRLADPKALLDTFVRGYALKLRPACLIGRYRHRNTNPGEILKAFRNRIVHQGIGTPGMGWAVTGGLAAREMTQYLEPDNVTLFVDKATEQIIRQETMLPDKNGNVTLLRLFAPNAIGHIGQEGIPYATPLLVYAELLNEGGPRELETAQMLFEKQIMPEARLD
ncbi:MAG: type IV toxin-antitoxin system AbiEi family antitoxin [Elusimicrobiota bacterium]